MNISIFTNRLYREAETIKVMVGIYCHHHHGQTVSQCQECSEIQNYALDRLRYCPYQEGKTSCKNCPIHCYKASMKEEVKRVMRFAGPRMVLRHPVLTIFHFIDDHRKVPMVVGSRTRNTTDLEDSECSGPLKPSQSI